MCITAAAMNEKMQEIQSLKRLREETENEIKSLEREIIEFLTEHEAECKTTNKTGKEILQFIGNIHKATYSDQSRETVDKAEVKKLLSDEEYQQVIKTSTYPVLRIS